MSRITRNYTKEYKEEAIKLAQKIGTTKAARELGIPEGTLSSWKTNARHGGAGAGIVSQEPGTANKMADEMAEMKAKLREYEKENAKLREENEFLEKASRFFAVSQRK